MWAVIILLIMCAIFPIMLCIVGSLADRDRMKLLMQMQETNKRMQEVLTGQPQIEYMDKVEPVKMITHEPDRVMLTCPVCGKDWRTCLFAPYDEVNGEKLPTDLKDVDGFIPTEIC